MNNADGGGPSNLPGGGPSNPQPNNLPGGGPNNFQPNNPQPNNPQPGGPQPVQASNNNHNRNFFDTIVDWDTDRLADWLDDIYQKWKPHKLTMKDTNIRFHKKEDDYSIIADYIKRHYNGIFLPQQPQHTVVNDSLISKIRDLKQNVPSDFIKGKK